MSTMRTLILGILNDNQPRHGYEIKQMLESWNADKWANIGYGSIYFALKKMAEEGLLAILDDQGPKDKTLYKITSEGHDAFMVMLRKQWLELKPSVDPFQVAVTFMHYLPKNELIIALEHRADMWRHIIKTAHKILPMAMKNIPVPKHIDENHALIIAHYKTELTWIETTLEKIKNNELL